MRSTSIRPSWKTRPLASSLLTAVFTFAWLGLATPTVHAGDVNEPQPKTKRAAVKSPVAKITEAQATEIALKMIPGTATSVAIEKKRGRKVYVVEIIAKADGAEKDVFVDMATGAVVGTD